VRIPIDLLALPLHWFPDRLHTELLARVGNHLLRGQPLVSRLPELDGRTVCIEITDVPSRLQFAISGHRLRPANHRSADVTIRGRLADFILLATRREDPDTLFFNRRLCIEGDTEAGLHIKNLLDALEYDWESHFRAVFGAPIMSFIPPLWRRPG